jgi:hypothetical protein
MIIFYGSNLAAARRKISAVIAKRHLLSFGTNTTVAAKENSGSKAPLQNQWLLGVSAAVLGAVSGVVASSRWLSVSTSPSVVHLEDITDDKNDTEVDAFGPLNDFGASPIENDPYENLPDSDEETHCILCKTYRQGPCRKYWRKTEACWKEGDSESCMQYSTPFFHCTQYYQNMYHLITLHNYQEQISDVEKDTPVHERQFWDDSNETNEVAIPPRIDWSNWIEFNKDFGPSFSQTIPSPPSNNSSSKLPLWQRLPPNTEPILIPCNVNVASTITNHTDETSKIMKLKMAYITDQDGFVLGIKAIGSPKNVDEVTQTEEDMKIDDAGENVNSNDEESTDNPVPHESRSVVDKVAVADNEQQAISSETTVDGDDETTSVESVDITSDTTTGSSIDPEDTRNSDSKDFFEFLCVFLPGETESIVVSAYYIEERQHPSTSETSQDTLLEAKLYKKVYHLNEIV